MSKKARGWLIAGGVIIVLLAIGSQQKPAATAAPAPTPAAAPAAPREIVYNSEWDASVRQVKDYLRDNLNDAKAVQYVEWSPVAKTGEGFIVRCKYRAKNAYGAFILAEQLFHMDAAGQVVRVTDYKTVK